MIPGVVLSVFFSFFSYLHKMTTDETCERTTGTFSRSPLCLWQMAGKHTRGLRHPDRRIAAYSICTSTPHAPHKSMRAPSSRWCWASRRPPASPRSRKGHNELLWELHVSGLKRVSLVSADSKSCVHSAWIMMKRREAVEGGEES